ncbi:hypothetical protein Adt_33807 [Abeliophyllum distichum]|uniref:Uncharacterized protein n=1 Tax=Abeliophyllum distichum TaxID=126358 RepID=A0ABD1QY77_9LAMI
MRLPLHLLFRRILRAYGLISTKVVPNEWSQMVGACICGFDTPSAWKCLCMCSRQFTSRGSCRRKKRVVDDPEPDLDVPSFYGIATVKGRRRRCLIYIPGGPADPELRIHFEQTSLFGRAWFDGFQRYFSACFPLAFVQLLTCVFGTAGMDQGRRLRPTLSRLMKQRPRVLVPGSMKDISQRKVIEDLSRKENRAEVAALDVVEVEDSCAPESGTSVSRPFSPRRRRLN